MELEGLMTIQVTRDKMLARKELIRANRRGKSKHVARSQLGMVRQKCLPVAFPLGQFLINPTRSASFGPPRGEGPRMA
jgi:hypothetical protein